MTLAPVTILYTQNLGGQLALLPPLHTFLRLLRQQAQRFEDDADVAVCAVQPPTRRVLVVDAGGSCAPDVWHCAATEGRSALAALDALGYDAAAVGEELAPGAREKLSQSVLMALVDEAHPYVADGVAVVTRENDAPGAAALTVVLKPGDAARLEGGRFFPVRLVAGQVGVAHIAAGAARLSAHEVHALPAGMRPDATIAGAVDFVLAEARLYARKRGPQA